jgi:hypothetical protein
VKTLCCLSKLAWFLKNHGIPESNQGEHKDAACKSAYEALLKDLQKHIEIFDKLVKE